MPDKLVLGDDGKVIGLGVVVNGLVYPVHKTSRYLIDMLISSAAPADPPPINKNKKKGRPTDEPLG